jgi:hypothetical protein
MEWFVADTITKIYVANQTSDGKWNVLVLPSDFDFSGGLPTGGEWYETGAEAAAEISRLINRPHPIDD